MPAGIVRNDLWNGGEKLVFGFDVGTTSSAVSYSHLVHGSLHGGESLEIVGIRGFDACVLHLLKEVHAL